MRVAAKQRKTAGAPSDDSEMAQLRKKSAVLGREFEVCGMRGDDRGCQLSHKCSTANNHAIQHNPTPTEPPQGA